MLLRRELESFFTENSLSLECEKYITSDQVDEIILKASRYGYSFASFILYAVINPDRNGILTLFSSWEDLYNSYAAFMTGFIMAQTASNN